MPLEWGTLQDSRWAAEPQPNRGATVFPERIDSPVAPSNGEAMMQDSEKDQAAKEVVDLRCTFDLALADWRKYPVQEFKAFVHRVRRYIEMTERDPMVHKSVARAVNGLREFFEVGRKRVPGSVLFDADRLECQFFEGYDPASKETSLRDCERRRFGEA
jgi:hypothetical protein